MSGPAPAATVAPPPAPATSRGRGRPTAYSYVPPKSTRAAQRRLGLVFAAPALALVAVFMLVPLGNAIYYAFVDFNGINPKPPWVGFSNFTELFGDEKVWAAFRHNVIWIIIGTIGPLVWGLGLALLVWRIRTGNTFYRIALFLPFVLPQVAVGVVWGWIYEPSRGWLNEALRSLGLDSFTRGWLGDPDTALYAVLATAMWATVGFIFVIFLSALRNVDADVVDASLLDGANS
jgi:raffinose/stachyose/melibiose transport system permease protein